MNPFESPPLERQESTWESIRHYFFPFFVVLGMLASSISVAVLDEIGEEIWWLVRDLLDL